MKIESDAIKLKTVFSSRKYIIPDYQRDYSWNVNEEITVFWDDFIYYLDKNPKSNFFIGPMVFKAESVNASQFEVIDGQQRLITFSILISVLVFLFEKYKNEDLSNGLKQTLIYKDHKNIDQLAIETEQPYPFFQNTIFHAKKIKPSNKNEKRIDNARLFFIEELEEKLEGFKDGDNKIEFLEKVRDYLFDIDTVIMVSDDGTDAFTIFETINTRGKDLSSLDLLKNYIAKNYTNSPGVKESKDTWKIITENIEAGRELFFNRFWASWVAKVTENKLYRRFIDYMRDEGMHGVFPDCAQLLNELLIASKIYKQMTKPSVGDWSRDKNFNIYAHIKNINGLFNVKVHFPFFLALFEEFEQHRVNLKLLNRTLTLMENFHFIFTHIVSRRASGLDNKYSKFAIRLRNEANKEKVINDLKKELLDKLPKKDEYIEKFRELSYLKNKETIKFILLRLESEIDKSLALDFELHSIEHLDPKSSSSKNINNIGNLFLLENKLNSDKDNLKPFELYPKNAQQLKTIEYIARETKYKTTKNELNGIIKSKIWSHENINARTENLAKETYIIFSNLN